MSSKLISHITLAWQTIRVKTLTVALSVVILSQSLAWHDITLLKSPSSDGQFFDYFLALIIFVCCLFLQISVNLANDYFDGLTGVDSATRQGPQRAIQSGRIKPMVMRNAIFTTTTAACLSGLYLILIGGWIFMLLGLISLFGVYAYSGGKKPLASLGLGEVAVFLYFGLLGVMASYALQVGGFNYQVFLPATQIGLLIAAIMLVNNIRDIETDKAAGKITLAVRLGEWNAKKLYAAFILIPFLLIPFDIYQPYLNFVLLPIGIFLAFKIQPLKRHHGDVFNHMLGQTSGLVFFWSLLYSCPLFFK